MTVPARSKVENQIRSANHRLLAIIALNQIITPKQATVFMESTSVDRIRARLNKLCDYGYLDKFRTQRGVETRYFITKKGRDCVLHYYEWIEKGDIKVITWDKMRNRAYNMQHALDINDFRTLLTKESTEAPFTGLTLNNWYNTKDCKISWEINSRYDDRIIAIEPDGLFFFDFNGKVIPCYLEIDNETHKREDYKAKFIKYLEFADAYRWKDAWWYRKGITHITPRYLFLGLTKDKIIKQKKWLQDEADKKALNTAMKSNYFLFAWRENDWVENVIDLKWIRAGYRNNFRLLFYEKKVLEES